MERLALEKEAMGRQETLGGRIRKKRLSLGMSRLRLAQFFGISWSTLQSWEEDRLALHCQERFVRRLMRFLSGEFDETLGNGIHLPIEEAVIPKELAMVFRKMRRVSELCSHSPEIHREMFLRLRTRAQGILGELSAGKRKLSHAEGRKGNCQESA